MPGMTFNLDAETVKKLNEIKNNLDAPSLTEVIRLSLSLMALASSTVSAKGQVILKARDGTSRQVLLM